jgi:hypothetical protein
MSDVDASWEKFLNPRSLKQNLIAASVFLAAYEMLKEALIGHLRAFFSREWTLEDGWKISDEYRNRVLSLDRKEMAACAKWFRDSGALDDEDLAALKEIAKHRNVVAHELPAILGTVEKDVSLLHLRAIYVLTTKIDQWWLREIEAAVNPVFDDQDLGEAQWGESLSMRMAIMSLLIQLAEGDDAALVELYEKWSRRFRNARTEPKREPEA